MHAVFFFPQKSMTRQHCLPILLPSQSSCYLSDISKIVFQSRETCSNYWFIARPQNVCCPLGYIASNFPKIVALSNTRPTSPQKTDYEKLRKQTTNTLLVTLCCMINHHLHHKVWTDIYFIWIGWKIVQGFQIWGPRVMISTELTYYVEILVLWSSNPNKVYFITNENLQWYKMYKAINTI